LINAHCSYDVNPVYADIGFIIAEHFSAQYVSESHVICSLSCFSVSVVACNEYAANVVFSILCCRIPHNYVDSVKGLHNLINLLIKVQDSVSINLSG